MTAPLALVTGATGWLGSRLVRLLVEGIPEVDDLAAGEPERPIRCLVEPGADRRILDGIPGRLEIVEGDLTRPPSLEPLFQGARGATLFHCAGVVHPTRGVRQFYAVNADGTRHLIELARRHRLRCFVHVSSNSPFGCNPDREHRFDESSEYNPYMGYGRSKMLAEQAVRAAEGDLETVIVRPPWFYGPNQPPRQTLFFKMIQAGRMPIVGDGGNLRSMAYVDNICQGLLLAERRPEARGQAYWIADRDPYSMNEIVETVERVLAEDFRLPVAHRRLRLPSALGDAARLADRLLQSAGIYHQKIHVLSEMNQSIACRVDKAVRELGYDPKVALEEGMRRSVQWLYDHGQPL